MPLDEGNCPPIVPTNGNAAPVVPTNGGQAPWSAELTRRWEAGETCSAIGKSMGLTKNTVIGRVHRLGLEPRRETPPPPALERAWDFPPPGHCQFAFGDNGAEDFHFCGVPNEPGYPYCPAHCERAYQNWTPGRKRPAGTLAETLATLPKTRTHDGKMPTRMEKASG